MRAALPLATAVAALLLAAPAEVHAAPKKQCIAAAESGQQLRSHGKLLEARRAFGACTATSCPAVVRRDCGRWIDEIDAATPSVTVRLEDEKGDDVHEGRVLLDGEPMRGSEGRATPVDPGVHHFVWSRDSGDIEQELVVREGEHNRVVVLRVPAPPRPPAVATEPPPPPTRSPVPWIIGGLGIAVAGAGAVMWGIGLNEHANLGSSCAPAHACAQSDVDASKTKLVVGDVMMGVGVVAIAGAVILLLSQGSVPATAITSASR